MDADVGSMMDRFRLVSSAAHACLPAHWEGLILQIGLNSVDANKIIRLFILYQLFQILKTTCPQILALRNSVVF